MTARLCMTGWLRVTAAIAARELAATVATPVAGVVLAVFLLLQGVLTFEAGGFLERDQADLAPFFGFLPWVFLLLVPALSMRLWAEERRSGTVELLLTLPVTLAQAMLGKFVAGLAACAVALMLTVPFVVAVNALGSPDNGVIATGYLGALLLAAAFLGVGCAISAATRTQVVAFVATLAVCFVFSAAASPLVGGVLGAHLPGLAAFGRRISLATRFAGFAHGEVALPDLLYFLGFTGCWLFAGIAVLDHRRAA